MSDERIDEIEDAELHEEDAFRTDDEIHPEDIARAVGAAARIQSYVAKDIEEQCAYCGQHFGPDDIVVEREIYGRKWRFCDENCLNDFKEKSDFQDEDLDGEKDIDVTVGSLMQ